MGFLLNQGGHLHSHGHGHSHGSAAASSSHSAGSGQQQRPHGSLAVRAAFIHALGDLLQSVGVLIAAYVVRFKVPCLFKDVFAINDHNLLPRTIVWEMFDRLFAAALSVKESLVLLIENVTEFREWLIENDVRLSCIWMLSNKVIFAQLSINHSIELFLNPWRSMITAA